MSIIRTLNPRTDNVPKSHLQVDQASGVGTIYPDNVNGFQADWAIQIGESGHEQSEIKLSNASTPSGTSIVLAANTDFAHPADTPVYAIKYDQVVFLKSTDGTAGTASIIANGTVSITPDTVDENGNFFTQFDDTAGASTDAYRTVFRNSAGGGTTSLSDWITPSGFDFYSLAKLRQRIKNKLWDSTFISNDSIIDDWINEWKEQMINEVIAVNEDYSMGTVDVAFGTDGFGTVTTTDFSQPRRFWVTYNGNDTYQSTKMNINDFEPDQQFIETHPYHAWKNNTEFVVKPASDGGTASITFYRFGTTMVNDTDTLPQPMRNFTKSFVDYGLAQAYALDSDQQMYRDKLSEAVGEKNQFISKIVPRDKTGPKFMDIVENISGNEDDTWVI